MKRLVALLVVVAVVVVALLAKASAISLAARTHMTFGLWFAVFFGFWWGLVLGGTFAYMSMGAWVGAYNRIDTSRMWTPKSSKGQWAQIAFIWFIALAGGFYGANFMLSQQLAP